jgi:putative ABC transport system substrate-binding protein
MKRIVEILCAAVMVFSLAACEAPASSSTADDGKYTIGICQIVGHPALDAATQGFEDAVKELLGEENVEILFGDAANEVTNCATIINGYVSSNVDLIMANATPAVAAAYNATDSIPILGTSVTEYGVALGIKDFSGVVGENVSGTSDLADLDKQADMILEWFPEAKQVGLLYCNAEANSKYQVDKVMEALVAKGVTCKLFPFADTSDMTAVAAEAANYSDVIYVPTDNTVANYANAIYSICQPEGVPIIAGEAGICEGCGVATMSIDYYDLGYETGKMAVEILRDGADITQMAIRYAPNVTYYYNEAVCEEMGITPLAGYEKLPTE